MRLHVKGRGRDVNDVEVEEEEEVSGCEKIDSAGRTLRDVSLSVCVDPVRFDERVEAAICVPELKEVEEDGGRGETVGVHAGEECCKGRWRGYGWQGWWEDEELANEDGRG